MDKLGRYIDNTSDGKGGYSQHTTVGSYLPNAWGLYDMHGNVWEWCLDWYGGLTGNVTNPVGVSSGVYRVKRGGGWYLGAGNCTASNRGDANPSSNGGSGGTGFRLACPVAQYLVVDLSGGPEAETWPVEYLDGEPEGGFNTDDYKTTKLVLRRIEGGTFMMCGEYQTTLTKPYYMGVFEVTQKQYELVTGSNPTYFKGDKLPVEQVSWNTLRGNSDWPTSAAVSQDTFMGRLRTRTGLEFDLPTEAQWEYACRAGTTTVYSYGDSVDDGYMWYSLNSSSKTHEAGTKLPNAWGLYDMHGNVWEWCLDWFGDLTNGVTDPKGLPSGETRSLRGGSWYHGASYCASSCRNNAYPSKPNYRDGFRLACPCE